MAIVFNKTQYLNVMVNLLNTCHWKLIHVFASRRNDESLCLDGIDYFLKSSRKVVDSRAKVVEK